MPHVRTRATPHFYSSLLTNTNKHFGTFSELSYSIFILILCFVSVLSKKKLSLVGLWLNRHFTGCQYALRKLYFESGGTFFQNMIKWSVSLFITGKSSSKCDTGYRGCKKVITLIYILSFINNCSCHIIIHFYQTQYHTTKENISRWGVVKRLKRQVQ